MCTGSVIRMSDRILICDICGKEKPDFDVKAVMCWWYYGSTYLVGDFYCPYCHSKTPTIIKSSKGTPETGDCKFEDLPTVHTRCRTIYGENKDCTDLIARAKQNRENKKQEKEEEALMPYRIRLIENQYHTFFNKYGSRAKASQAFSEWLKQNKELEEWMKKNNISIG